ncbi:Solute carrier family 35 member E3 [Lachnellula suecica]|uniref:GDP-mannose transporter n=1 Tax=Lachnellula suecica TaxID=602035 RepID=A0A8T9C0H4_9HELO|nr:Solute carrier family 35 member E3 [Lachnellula suecica]
MPDNAAPENGIPLLERERDIEAATADTDTDSNKPYETPSPPPSQAAKRKSFLTWTAINMAATIGIVFTNKAIFNDPAFKLMQTSFASFHFMCTGLTLYVVSRKAIGAFVPKRAGVVEMLPLALSMCLNVVLPNLSLAFSTVTVYQLCRVLLTPSTAILNFVLYRATIPRAAALALIPVCLGVGITSYYDTKPPPASGADGESKIVATTSTIGIFFALSGVFASSVYTVLIAAYHKKLQMSSSQLLFNQAPISSLLLFLTVPFVDHIPVLSIVPGYRWAMILMSGAFAALINISQFFIVAGSGPVSSTVVGHLKTVSIVGLGWAFSGRGVGDASAGGVVMTVGGIIGYSYIMLNKPKG